MQHRLFEPSTLQKVLGDFCSDYTVNEEVVDISDIPYRRTILEVGAAGLLRDGDNSGTDVPCREMMSRDSEVSREIKANQSRERNYRGLICC